MLALMSPLLASLPAVANADGVLAEARAACQTALAAERAGAATYTSRTPCHLAAKLTSLPEDMRNEVSALMSPAAHPALDDLGVALMLVDAAVNKAADQPWGHLARCDVARRLGHAAALETCLTDLNTMARKHPASQQALASMRVPASPGVWAGRIGLLLILAGTLAHALRGWRRRAARDGRAADPRATSAVSVAGVVVSLAIVLAATPARAAPEPAIPTVTRGQLSEFDIDDDDPERSVPSLEVQNRKPLQFGYFLQDLGGKAEAARTRGDHVAAGRYFRALTAAAPDAAYGPRQLCVETEAAGDLPAAIVACRTAITREGSTVGDYERFATVALARKEELAPLERKEIEAVIAHVESTSPGTIPNRLRCELGIRVGDQKVLEACTGALAKLASDDAQTVSYQWALALMVRDKEKAAALIDRARTLGMAPEGVARMERATSDLRRRDYVRVAVVVMTAIFAALAMIALRSRTTRRRVVRPA
jgi:hypothetical protein